MQQLENIETEQFAAPVNIEEKNHLFPVFLKLENLKVLLIGAGKVGLEKLTAIIHNAPATDVTVVADKISAEVRHLAQAHNNIHLTDRLFQSDDLEGKDIVAIAVDDKETSAYIRALAKEKKLLVNVADTPDQCDFYLGSIVQKGSLKIAISTNGKSPTVAKRIKEVLQSALPADLDSVINNLNAIRNRLSGDFEAKVKRLNELTKGLVENEQAEKERKWRRVATYSLLIFASMLIGHVIFYYIPMQKVADGAVNIYHSLDKTFLIMIGAGFLAQLVDGALGMGYGVTSATILLSAGVNLSAISSSIHTAEMFASGASGYSHYKFGNVNKKLFKILVIPGVIGAIAGAYLLSKYGDKYANYVRPFMAVYTLLIGLRIMMNAFRQKLQQKKFKHYRFLALAGGFLDSFSGGGWGPIVTTTLISRGRNPKYVIGSISLTEFFVTLASALTFFSLIGVSHWQVIVALIIGGLTAAPVAAKLAGKLPKKISFILLGLLVITWSIKILVKIF